MKSRVLATLTAAAASVVMMAVAAPAQALSFSFGTNGIKFDNDTTVDFEFRESHGSYTSGVSIFEQNNLSKAVANLFWETKQSDNKGANEWKGSFGNAVTSSTGLNLASFTFKSGVAYTLGLMSGSNGTVYSTNSLNRNLTQQAVFGDADTLWSALDRSTTAHFSAAPRYSSGDLFNGPVLISFDDRGNKNDTDFQDFTLQARAQTPSQPVPEPLSLGGIALAGAGLSYFRRRQQKAKTV